MTEHRLGRINVKNRIPSLADAPKKRPRGRPPTVHGQYAPQMHVGRVPADQQEIVDQAIEISGESRVEFIMGPVLAKARKILSGEKAN